MLSMYYVSKYGDDIEKLILIGAVDVNIDLDFTSDNRTARASIIQREFMMAARDSIDKNIATEKTKRALAQLMWRLSLYDAYKADSIIQILSTSTRNQQMNSLI